MSTQRHNPTIDTVPRPLTYAEVSSVPTFDWNLFLARARANQVTWEEHLAATFRAGSWTTCACGNMCSIIPRYEKDMRVGINWKVPGEPIDERLSTLGMRFYRAIEAGNWSLASITLTNIEVRSAQLIATFS